MPGKIVHGCAYALPGLAKGKAWVISPEFLLSNFPAFLSLKMGSTLCFDKFQAMNGCDISKHTSNQEILSNVVGINIGV